VLDTINASTGTYDPREIGAEHFSGWMNDVRFLSHYRFGKQVQAIAVGGRFLLSDMQRQGGGEGSTGSDPNFMLANGEFEYDLNYRTINASIYAENTFRIADKFTITPGVRMEYIRSSVKGYVTDILQVKADERSTRVVPLYGIGMQYSANRMINVYANVSRAYRPIDYSALTPIGVSSKIDPRLHDASGYNVDLGFKGDVKNILNYDISAFLLSYKDRIGLVEVKDAATGNSYALRTNVANSLHVGVESYFELNMLKLFQAKSKIFQLSVFNSTAYVHARYNSGLYAGKRVEYAPDVISRTGLNFRAKGFSATWQCSYQSFAFGDASNAMNGDEPGVGYIPAYYIMDISASYSYKVLCLKAGMNNISDQKYFTRRADEYPGPGIIPSIGRNYYLGISVKY
jgi:Fe(3+) dicitrate transport protein